MFHCDICNSDLPSKNRLRHIRTCSNSRLRCPCGIDLRVVTKKHKRSKRHKEFEQQNQSQKEPNTLSHQVHPKQQPSHQLALNTLQAHKIDASHPLSAVYLAWENCLRTGGVQDMMPGREPSKYWKEIGLDPPSIFPAKEIWLHMPGDDDEVLDDLLHNYDNRQSMVFVRGEPSRPLSGALPKVLRQLKIPDERQTLSAFNIRSSVLSMKIPEVISARYPPDSAENTVKVNITPRGAVVDLHFDPLSHGITGCASGCIKLWGTWPPSDNNIRALLSLGPSNNRFIDLHQHLEGGEFGVTTNDSAIYIPPLCLHATLTLRGGLTPGIQFSSAACLRVGIKAWELESAFHSGQLREFYSQVYKALDMAFRSRDPIYMSFAIKVFCERKAELRSDKRRFREIKADLQKRYTEGCIICSQDWRSH